MRGGRFIGNLNEVCGDYEMKLPMCEKFIEKRNVYVLRVGYKRDSCVYTKLFILM